MEKKFFFFVLLTQSFCLFGGKQEDLNRIAAITERTDENFYTLVATLKGGAEIVYKENISGENSGFATCSTTSASHADVSNVDYWRKLFQEKLKKFRGI